MKDKNRSPANKDFGIYPMMPTRFSPKKRKELREFEKKLLKGRKINV